MKDITVNPSYPDDLLKDKTMGKDIFHAPQPALTAVDSTAFATGSSPGTFMSSSNVSTLNNLRTRVNELETVLIKLGLLKHP